MDETTKTAEKPTETLPKNPETFMDKLRKRWDGFAFQSTLGNWAIRLILALVILLALMAAADFGLSAKGSLLNDFLRWLSKYWDEAALVPTILAVGLAVLWLFFPMFGSLLCAGMLYVCYATVAPTALLIAMLLFLLFLAEERTVLALTLALPALCFSTALPAGLFLVVWAAFASTRKNNGTVKTLSFVYFTLLELCRGSFGIIKNKAGVRVLPAPDAIRAAVSLKRSYAQWGAGQGFGGVFWKILILLAIVFIIGLVFAKLLNLRFKPIKLPIDALDGLIFALVAALWCALGYVLPQISELEKFPCGIPSILLQVLAAYVVTRPIAGPSPDRGNLPARNQRHYAFISYAHLDLTRVKPCLNILEDKGYDFWYDNAITTGSAWRDIIAGNLAGCTCFIAFISKASLQSDYCLKELNYAISKKKPIALVMLDDTPLPPTIEMFLASMQCVRRYKFDSDAECMEKVFGLEGLDLCRQRPL